MPQSKTSDSFGTNGQDQASYDNSIDQLVGGTVNPPTKTTQTPSQTQQTQSNPQPYNDYSRFDGYVDNRVIPDAGMPTEEVEGILDMDFNGHGLLRPKFAASDNDVYISTSQIRRFRLRPGDMIKGPARRPKESERYWGLLKVSHVNGVEIEKLTSRIYFDRLTPVYPDFHLKLETEKDIFSTRLIDLIAPIGRGQRGLIVSPPKAGKTILLKQIANGVTANYPDIHLMAVLVGERPEEVTDISRSIRGEVAASNFDEQPERQVKVAELALERAKRLVELGRHVFILLDSITRLARAYNLAIPTSGRTLSGGFDPAALYPPKRFFGAARNFEEFETFEGKKTGSLTIIGTALVDTGSRMDDLIYEEFKGTGNQELHLDRRLAERRIYPAIDVQKSSTRMDHLLYGKTADKIKTLITMTDMLSPDERTEILIERMKKYKTNTEFLEHLGKE
ncbi:transcription termination factor Rho [Candidatus Beckwithbacteria bacterium CG23_combo_of_CG06-09_8_20_14_all_34_8]|uniref:Transcription termination factor Rho n=1 Tax=Candidatus Beckwithbacteria bacterium CG23_combo_of_CG06-09_8_20_14_all_34_8 TaxID=1974497 RepID=A0A2H0B6J1_9BACT|nr:MAG: transcription termination factor Rho [Candidatus Beckwithbacteria bacterium CG23_combo_of_CG06-09_8_20_14_all_34_8]